jgi:hypothetical protein
VSTDYYELKKHTQGSMKDAQNYQIKENSQTAVVTVSKQNKWQ